MRFEDWKRWCNTLDDADFARAFTALGVAAGSEAQWRSVARWVQLIESDPSQATPDNLLVMARFALSDALGGTTRKSQGHTRWSFPSANSTVDAEGRFALRRIDPASWARAWLEVVDGEPRLRVADVPEQEPIAPWLRLLAEAQPPVGAVSVVLPVAKPNLAIEWPLRVAALADAPAVPVVETLLLQWPSQRHTRRVPLDRDNANCDVLLHVGPAASLLAALRAQPFPCKANLVVLAGTSDGDPVIVNGPVRTVADETRASGIVLLSSHDPHTLACTLNRFVEEMSHNAPLDHAWTAALRGGPACDTVILLTDALADLQLRSLAVQLAARARALPPRTRIDLSHLGSEWVKIAPPGEVSDGGIGSGTSPGVDAVWMCVHPGRLNFDAESRGASEVAAFSTAVEAAVEPPDAEGRSAARYLQQQSFVLRGALFEKAVSGFVQGCPALVRVRIGPKEGAWQSLPQEFPVESLPPDQRYWRLTVWLTEPSQLHPPVRRKLKLPRQGASTECEFRFTPRLAGRFEGRLTVLHRGRVLQTAVLRAGVVAADAPADPAAAPTLQELVPVRHRLGDLDRRRQFDLAFVVNHTAGGEPRGVALSGDRAWIADVSKSLEIAKDINTALSRVAKSVTDYHDGLDGEAGRKLFVALAQKGAWLHLYLVSNQLNRPTNRPDIAEKEYIQIVSTRTDATVPFEFIYDYEVPDDDATACARWRDALVPGHCPPDCAGGSAKAVCPLGFWGLRKVIERHQVTPEYATEGKEFFLQSEPGRDTSDLPLGGTALFASSKRVPVAIQEAVERELETKLGAEPRTANNWSEWATIVGEAKPHLLIALTHTDGTGANVTLEIGGNAIGTIQIKEAHLRGGADIARPLVALLGCDTAGTANDYGESVVVFRDRGAAVVIGTIATVFGEHAARVAILLADELVPNGAPPQRLGEAIRTLKRRALLDGLLMPLCLVAYGDADWRLVR